MFKFASVAFLVCALSVSTAMAQTPDPVKEGHAIAKGVDAKVDAKTAALEKKVKELEQKLAAQTPVAAAPQQVDPRCDGRCQAARVMQECGRDSVLFQSPGMWPVKQADFEDFLVRECPKGRAERERRMEAVQFPPSQPQRTVQEYPPVGPDQQNPDQGPDEDAQLEKMLARKAIRVLGPPSGGYQGYAGSFTGPQPLPPGCTERKVEDKRLHRMFVRVTCN